MADEKLPAAVSDEVAERISDALVTLLELKRDRHNLYSTREGRRTSAALGHRVLRLVNEALRPETVVAAPAPKPAKRRHENGWTVLLVAQDRSGAPWVIWQNAGGEHQVAQGAEKTAEAPAAGAGGWKDLSRLMRVRGLSTPTS